MIRYTITRHRRLEGVGLSRLGDWGGLRFPDDEAAERHARDDAKGASFTIERETK